MEAIRQLPPSRRDKKQVGAHLDPGIVDAVHARRRALGLTNQEIIADAVNSSAAHYGRPPLLKSGRDRLVKREKALAQIQTSEKAPGCRAGKRRVAAWFDRPDVERLGALSRELGVAVEDLIEAGIRRTVLGEDGTQAQAA